MKINKIITILLAALLLFMAGCKKDNGNTDKDYSQGSNTIDEYTEDLWIEDYEEYNYRILIRAGQTTDQYLEEGSDDPIEDAVYKRNKLVEEMFNIKITATESSSPEYDTDALNPILAGDDAYDIVFNHTGAAFVYAARGAALNLNEIDTLHLEKPWWSKDMVEGCNLGGNLFVLDGDISMHRLKYSMCLYFNKRIFDELGLEYPYELVEYGEWTFDEFEELVKQGGKDLNGDGVITPEFDQYGLITTHWGMPIGILYTGGQRIYSKNDEGILELTLNTQKTVDIYDSFFDLTNTESALILNNAVKYTGPGIFDSGRAMFQASNLGIAQSLRSMEDNFGILPYPKYEYEDDYATIINGFAHIFVIPITVEDEERTGAITEALCAIGSRDVLPVFYDQSLKTKFTRDNESEGMIDIIRDSLVYDVGYATGGPLGYFGNNLANSTSPDFSSLYASTEASALASLRAFNEAYAGIFE